MFVGFVSSFVVMKEITDSLKYKQDEALYQDGEVSVGRGFFIDLHTVNHSIETLHLLNILQFESQA